MTQAQLAAAVSVDRLAITRIENGTRRVTALELAHIADAVGERLEWLVRESHPPSIVSRRDRQDPGAGSTVIDRVVEQVIRNVEFVARHDDRWPRVSFTPLRRPAGVTAVESAAADVRARLGLDSREPLLDVAAAALRLGLLPFSLDLGRETADGASVLLESGGVSLVNGQRQSGRRRLTQAHELAHYVFADEYEVDWRVAEQRRTLRPGSPAATVSLVALLLPEQGLREAWAAARGRDGHRTAAVRLGSAFAVDMSTLSRRLGELGLANESELAAVRAVRTTRADIVEMDLVVREELVPPSLPRPYEEAVLRLYRSEHDLRRPGDRAASRHVGGRGSPATGEPAGECHLDLRLLAMPAADDATEALVFDTGPLTHFAKSGWLGVLKAVVGDRQVWCPTWSSSRFAGVRSTTPGWVRSWRRSALADDLLATSYRLPLEPGGFEKWYADNGEV